MEIRKVSSLIAFSALILSGCAGRKSAIGVSQPQAPAAAPPADARAAADALWAARGNPDTARLALEAYGRAAAAAPQDKDLLARLSRAHYLVANYVETDAGRKDSLFLKGVEAAERSLARHEGFRKAYEESKDEKKAVAAAGKEELDALLWYAANLGKWAATKGLMVRLGNKAKLEAFNKRILELDENFFYGAAHRFFGALPTKVPGGDLKVAKQHFEKALRIAPDYFATRTLYAELYATKAREKETFVQQLDYVLNGNAAALPDVEPENRYEQAFAKQLKEKTNEWFD